MARTPKRTEDLSQYAEICPTKTLLSEIRQQIIIEMASGQWSPMHIYQLASKHGQPPPVISQLASEALSLLKGMQTLGGLEGIRTELLGKLQAAYEAAAGRRALPRKANQQGHPWPDAKCMIQAAMGIARLHGLDTQKHEIVQMDPLQGLTVEVLREIQRTGQLPPGLSLPGFAPRALELGEFDAFDSPTYEPIEVTADSDSGDESD